MFKKFVFVLSLLLFIVPVYYTNAADVADFPYKEESSNNATTDGGKILKKGTVEGDSILDMLTNALSLGGFANNESPAISYIQTIINYFLSILAFVSLVILIIGLYMMLTNYDYEESFSKAKKYFIRSIISIFVIGTSWFIISFILFVVGQAV